MVPLSLLLKRSAPWLATGRFWLGGRAELMVSFMMRAHVCACAGTFREKASHTKRRRAVILVWLCKLHDHRHLRPTDRRLDTSLECLPRKLVRWFDFVGDQLAQALSW